MTGDIEHGVAHENVTHFVCVCGSSGHVLYFSFWGVCRSTYILLTVPTIVSCSRPLPRRLQVLQNRSSGNDPDHVARANVP